jgi:predicted transposase
MHRTLEVREEAPSCRYRLLEAAKEKYCMAITLTAKLTTTPDQFAALRATQLAYRDALNLVSQYAFAHGKTSSRRRLQRALYAEVRGQSGLSAQMACSVFRQVGATYQGLWTKARKNAEARRRGYTKKRFRGLDQAAQYVSPMTPGGVVCMIASASRQCVLIGPH